MVKCVEILCDAALEEIDGREVGKAAGECIAVLRGLVTLDGLALLKTERWASHMKGRGGSEKLALQVEGC